MSEEQIKKYSLCLLTTQQQILIVTDSVKLTQSGLPAYRSSDQGLLSVPYYRYQEETQALEVLTLSQIAATTF